MVVDHALDVGPYAGFNLLLSVGGIGDQITQA